MKRYARIDGGCVVEFYSTDGDISKIHHPSLIWAHVDDVDPVPDIGWQARQNGAGWEFAPPSLQVSTPEQLVALVASERFMREATGVAVEGFVVESTRDSQALIASTGLSAILDPEYRCNFKTAEGFVEIGAVQIIAIAKAVRAHVQACFDRELALLRAIEAGEYRDEMLDEGWPDSLPSPGPEPDPAELQ
jgi:hypothetical protein